MKRTNKSRVVLTQVLVMALVVPKVVGQPAPPNPLSGADFVALLQSRQKDVDDLAEVSDEAKKKIKELYQQGLGEMEASKRWAAMAAQNEKLAADAPRELEETKAALALPVRPPALPPANATLVQVEQAISNREAELEKLRKTLADDEETLKNGATRRARLTDELGKLKENLGKITEQIQMSAADDSSAATGTSLAANATNMARRLVLMARRKAEEQKISCQEKELLAYEARTSLFPLRRDLNARAVALAEAEVKEWQEWVNRQRQQEAEQQSQQAALEAGQANPAVRQLLQENAALAEMRKSLAACIADTTGQLERVKRELATLTEQFRDVQNKVKTVGLTNIIGQLLRKQRDTLPDLRAYRRNIGLRQQTIDEGQLARLQLDDKRKLLVALDRQVEETLQAPNFARGDVNRGELEAAVRQALNSKRDYLDVLIRDNDTYYEKVVNLYAAEQKLIAETERFSHFINERVLWIASAAPLEMADVQKAGDALRWVAGPEAWIDVGRTFFHDMAGNPVLSIFAWAVVVLLIYWRLRFRGRLQEIGEKAERGSCYRFLPTLEATLMTVLMALGWPGLMWYCGWRLSSATEASELCKSLGMGLTETSRVFLALELLRHTCGYRGLGESHFAWSAPAVKLLRHAISWSMVPMLLLMCVSVTMAWQENDRWDASLGRVCFTAAMLVFALLLHRLLRPGGVVFHAMIAARQGGWLERLRYVWYPLCVLTPMALGVLAVVGYHYTARQLVIRLILTTYVLVGGIIGRALLLRWTLVNQRKLAIEQARQRRAAAQAESSSGDEASGVADLPGSTMPERDLATINKQTRRLVEYSLAVACSLVVWCAWIDVLPALGNINASLGKTNVVVSKESPSVNGEMEVKFVEELRDIRLSDVFLALIILATTVIAAKNIPGLLEMAVLQHLPFDAGARYAVATVCRYVITLVGVTLACGSLGVGWSKVQWLVAAMSLGLGFGLQEIFANFVSGLIILIERPVRVGDVVTIDGVTGVVSRIRMRATTVTDGDRKELIIPNKEFITGRVLNWTLTDPVNRVVVRVGVAYGSDTERAAAILLDVAKRHPHILAEPMPGVALESFGDSALNFVLRCFLPNLENRGAVIHELHMAIDREFRQAGIEIAFPQQDVHVRSIDLPSGVLSRGMGGETAWDSSHRAA
jgi:potassium efflux system protein